MTLGVKTFYEKEPFTREPKKTANFFKKWVSESAMRGLFWLTSFSNLITNIWRYRNIFIIHNSLGKGACNQPSLTQSYHLEGCTRESSSPSIQLCRSMKTKLVCVTSFSSFKHESRNDNLPGHRGILYLQKVLCRLWLPTGKGKQFKPT